MHIATLQLELLIRHAESLKDKRRVVRSFKDRVHRAHQVSVAEVAALDEHRRAVLGVAAVASTAPRATQVIDAVLANARALNDADLGDITRSTISRDDLQLLPLDENDNPRLPDADTLAEELIAHASSEDTDAAGLAT